MTASSAWLRRLPAVVPPVHDETLASFGGRLAGVNRVPVELLVEVVARARGIPQNPGDARVLDADHLAHLTGIDQVTLRRALPELRLDRRTIRRRRRIRACTRCTHRHRGGAVVLSVDDRRYVCVRHRTWLGTLGPGAPLRHTTPAPVDVDALPEVMAAQRRLDRLHRRHGSRAVGYAVSTAVAFWDRQDRIRRHLTTRQRARVERLRPGTERLNATDPLAHIACFPEIITVAGVLASPYWHTPDYSHPLSQAATTEIQRRLHLDEDRATDNAAQPEPSRRKKTTLPRPPQRHTDHPSSSTTATATRWCISASRAVDIVLLASRARATTGGRTER